MSSANLSEMETLFNALADQTRLRLLNLMRGGEVCVWYFTEVLGDSQPKVSRHLAYLRNAGVVEARREGKWMYYGIIDPANRAAVKVLNDIIDWMETDDDMAAEYDDLLRLLESKNKPEVDEIYAQPYVWSRPVEELETFLL